MPNETTTLKIGDVVHLNSGSPKMTVHAIDGDEITAVWLTFGEHSELKTAKLHKDMFYPVRPLNQREGR